MSADFIIRLIGMIVFAIIGVYWGTSLGNVANAAPSANTFSVEQYAFTIGLVGALVGLILTPFITTRPIRAVRNLLGQVSAQSLFASLAGIIAGLIVAALLAFPLSLLPPPFGKVLPFLGVLVCGYLGVAVFVMRQNDLFGIVSSLVNRSGGSPTSSSDGPATKWNDGRTILLDTSVIIDGRIADIARTGFLPGSLLIPRFVLNELQYIADSPDSLRRQRGRRGMEVLSSLQKEPTIPVRISDMDVEGVREVDDKLVILARQLRCPILTNDYNLNRIAELQGYGIDQAKKNSQMSGLGNLGGMALLASDESLKTEIERLPVEALPGVPFASWRWKKGGRGFGVIAQDVERVRPDLVHRHPDGYLMVDYSFLDR
ncbi:MAG TPA: tail fiber domain-containing protein [Anaerolineales bacterium]